MRFLFFLFILIPIVELAVLIQIGQVIGALWTVALVVLTAFIGINMLRVQGLATLTSANIRMQAGRIPAQEMVEGIFLAVGGALLLTPGVITDAFGFLCLIPMTRLWMVRALQVKFVSAFTNMKGSHAHASDAYSKADDGVIIEGEVAPESSPNKHNTDIEKH